MNKAAKRTVVAVVVAVVVVVVNLTEKNVANLIRLQLQRGLTNFKRANFECEVRN